MLINIPKNNTNIQDVAAISSHRCIGCLRGGDAAKRDCALRHLLAEGLTPDAIDFARTSSKTAH